jgi:hypothetical protein
VPVTLACASKGIAGMEKVVNVQSFGLTVILFSSNGGALFVEIYEKKNFLFIIQYPINRTRCSLR